MAKITKRVKKLNSRNKKHTKVRHSKPLKYVTKKHKRKQNKKKRHIAKNIEVVLKASLDGKEDQ